MFGTQERQGEPVSTIKPTQSQGPIEITRPTESVKRNVRVEPARTDRVALRREDSGVHRLYQSVDAAEASDRAKRVAEIKKAVENGSYRPNLKVVAERLLPDLGLDLR